MPEHDLRTYYTLAELKQRMINEQQVQLVDVLRQPLNITEDILFTPANLGDDFAVAQNLYEPQGSEVNYNQGAPVTVGQAKQENWKSAIIEDWWQIEEKIARRSGNPKQAMFNEEMLHVGGLRKRLAQRLFHGTGAGLQITGLAGLTNYASLGKAYVFDNAEGASPSGSSNKTSIWFIKHSPQGFHCFHPKGQDGELIRRDYKGLQTMSYTDPEQSDTRLMDVYRGKLTMSFGIVVVNPAAVVRIPNISMSGWNATTEFDINPKVLLDALNYIDAFGEDIPGKLVCYMHHQTRARLWRLTHDLTLTREYDKALEARVYSINGVPVKCCNQMAINESKLTT